MRRTLVRYHRTQLIANGRVQPGNHGRDAGPRRLAAIGEGGFAPQRIPFLRGYAIRVDLGAHE